jgi:hypothetical protein
MYDHEYATCAQTYATLCVFHDDLDPDAVTRVLGFPPSSSHRRGDVRNCQRPIPYTAGAWFLTSEGTIKSRDVRCHIDWLLEQVGTKRSAFEQLKAQGCRMVISSYWLSAHGHGGPMVEPEAMRRLADLGVQIAFDVYFLGEDGGT